MKQVNGYEVQEFVYESREERDTHVEKMEKENWMESGQVRRLKEGVNVSTATKDDYDWYASFQRWTLS